MNAVKKARVSYSQVGPIQPPPLKFDKRAAPPKKISGKSPLPVAPFTWDEIIAPGRQNAELERLLNLFPD